MTVPPTAAGQRGATGIGATSRASAIEVRLDRDSAAYSPGDSLVAEVALSPVWCTAANSSRLKSVELSVVWYTAGMGDEDLHVHEFVRVPIPRREGLEASGAEPTGGPLAISTQLPASPQSYAGAIVKVCWCVRARLFDAAGRQTLVEQPFRLGAVAAAAVNENSPVGGASP